MASSRRRSGFGIGLRERSDLRALAFLLVQALLTAAVFVRWVPLWLGLYPLCWLSVIAANAKHNHMHRRTFRSAWANLVLDHWLGWLTGATATSIITEHNLRHHAHPGSDQDFMRSGLVGFRSQLLNLLCFFPRAARELYLRKPLDLRLWWRGNRPLFWRGLAEQLTLGALLASLLVLDWRMTLLCLVVPWLHGQWWLVTFNLLQHQDLAPDDPWQNSRNLTAPWFNFFFLNVGYHTAHHLRPALHWSRLPAFHASEIAPRIAPALVSPGLWGFYRDWFLRKHAARPDTP